MVGDAEAEALAFCGRAEGAEHALRVVRRFARARAEAVRVFVRRVAKVCAAGVERGLLVLIFRVEARQHPRLTLGFSERHDVRDTFGERHTRRQRLIEPHASAVPLGVRIPQHHHRVRPLRRGSATMHLAHDAKHRVEHHGAREPGHAREVPMVAPHVEVVGVVVHAVEVVPARRPLVVPPAACIRRVAIENVVHPRRAPKPEELVDERFHRAEVPRRLAEQHPAGSSRGGAHFAPPNTHVSSSSSVQSCPLASWPWKRFASGCSASERTPVVPSGPFAKTSTDSGGMQSMTKGSGLSR